MRISREVWLSATFLVTVGVDFVVCPLVLAITGEGYVCGLSGIIGEGSVYCLSGYHR